MGLCARKTAEFSELKRVGCHVAVPVWLWVWLVMQPRLDCVMEKRRLRITVSGLEYQKGDPLKSNGIDIDVCPSYSINSIVPPVAFQQLKILCFCIAVFSNRPRRQAHCEEQLTS